MQKKDISHFDEDKGHEILDVILLKIVVPKGTMYLFKDLELDYITTKRLENCGSMELWNLSNNIFFTVEEDKYDIYSEKLVKKIHEIMKNAPI